MEVDRSGYRDLRPTAAPVYFVQIDALDGLLKAVHISGRIPTRLDGSHCPQFAGTSVARIDGR